VSSSAAIYVLHDQQGTPLGMVRGGTSYAFVTDNIGSVTAIVDSSGSTDATYTYDPYGTVLSGNGSLAPANLLSYTGALTDISSGNATGYTHNGNRWYDTATGAFTTQDTSTYLASPANGNRYAYAADNPVIYVDPTGQGIVTCSEDLGLGVAGGLFGMVSGFFAIVTAPTVIGAVAGTAGFVFGEGAFIDGLYRATTGGC
jgi:RHS repeat-associated protein